MQLVLDICRRIKNILIGYLNYLMTLNFPVRERDGQQIIKQLTGRDAELVLDPTLLVKTDYLRNLIEPAKRTKKYVLFFCIKPSKKQPILQKICGKI